MIVIYELRNTISYDALTAFSKLYKIAPTKFTGRWKLHVVDGQSCLYIELRYMKFLKRWVHEKNIVVKEENVYINKCEEGKK